uniref:isoleucine--tRNA ligase n=1 Tax=Novosphingobium sp. TaxID=1874826 RepID=UPI00260C3618
GLPIEWKVEEEYRKKKKNKDEVPPVEFRAECRAYAQKWVDVQREQLKRLGINGDWDHPYLTMDPEAEGTIVAELLKFAESGQLYRGAKPVMWSPVEKTALAEAEIEYEDIVSTQIDVAFEITEAPNCPELVGAYAVIWTTTPWTIPVNQALAYGPEVGYSLIELDGRRFVVGAELIIPFLRRMSGSLGRPFEVVADEAKVLDLPGTDKQFVWGKALAGTICRHPMHHLGGFFAKPRPMLSGDFVTTDSGTGLVHMAPDHGEDDFALCKAHGIEPVFAVLGDGKYREDWGWLGGQGSVINPKFNAPDGPICLGLREAGGLLAASADYKHSYPHSWRSKAKVIYRCTPQWFVPMDRPVDMPHAESRAENRWDNEGGALEHPNATLRKIAVQAIAETRWVPEKGRNRIGAMVEGRPDWVLSRQRAWGVPITLFVDRKSGQYLADPAVNARIVAAVRSGGVDAWSEERAQEYLGSEYKLEDYERVTDILDVWFDSGSTHAFVLESGRWPDLLRPEGYTGPHADLYLEGSDQHRGWFQSSLLEACATRGHAPYKAVLTHGFTMDSKGMKMSKSLGNTISPIDLMKEYGADILRLWALSVDFTEDHRIGKEILQGVADQYRKLRNTFRYLLGALEGYDHEAERVGVDEMPELERYILNQLFHLDVTLDAAIKNFDFNTYTRALTDFCNEDLSAFFFDIRKDCLYCDAPSDPKRRAYRTVLDVLFHALVRYAAPVLVFTAEEVWGTRFPDAGSVHMLSWFKSDLFVHDPALTAKWDELRGLRQTVNEAIEPLRREKVIGSSLQAEVTVPSSAPEADLAELFITAQVMRGQGEEVIITPTTLHKCGRCWRHLPEVTEDGALCARCDDVVAGLPA